MDLREIADASAWDALVADHRFGHPLQCWGWGEVKCNAGWRAHRLAVFEGTTFRAGAQVLTRPIPGVPLALTYAPRGPVAAPEDAEALRALATGLREHGARQRAIYCKLDPAWPVGTPHVLAAVGFQRAAADESVQVTDT